jgi:hypothetical protein
MKIQQNLYIVQIQPSISAESRRKQISIAWNDGRSYYMCSEG